MTASSCPIHLNESPLLGPQSSEVALASREKVIVRVVAPRGTRHNLSEFWVRWTTPFERMMEAWCNANGLSPRNVKFGIDGQTLQPMDSLMSHAGSVSGGRATVNVCLQREQANNRFIQWSDATSKIQVRNHTSSAGTSQCSKEKHLQGIAKPPFVARFSDARPEAHEMVAVEVVAHCESGSKPMNFQMRAATRFEKMMVTWCSHHGFHLHDALFVFNEQILQPEDCPTNCGWSALHGPLMINVAPTSGRLWDEVLEEHDATNAISTEPNEANLSVCFDDETSFEIFVKSSGCDSIGKFNISANTVLESILQEWCIRRGLSLVTRRFSFEGRQIGLQDTPSSLGWSQKFCRHVILADPIDTTPATRPSASLGKEIVTVQVVARGAEGENVTVVKMKSKSRFSKLMASWCQQMRLPQGKVKFMLGGREVRGEDSPLACGCFPTSGCLVISVHPRSAEVPGLSKHTSRHSGDRMSRNGDAEAPMTETFEPGRYERRALLQSAVDIDPKQRVAVIIHATGSDGEKVLTFKMMASSAFEKVMLAWCAHHGVKPDDVAFLIEGNELQPCDTPQRLGSWLSNPSSRVDGMQDTALLEFRVQAVPRKALEDKSLSPGEETVDVRVVASLPAGPTDLEFRMKRGASLGKLLSRLHAHCDLPEGALGLFHEGRRVAPTETPTSLGCEQEITLDALERPSCTSFARRDVQASKRGRAVETSAPRSVRKKVAVPPSASGGWIETRAYELG